MARKLSKLPSKIKDLPSTPGVYMFLDSEGKIIYVGKALRLRSRVSSYFQAGRARDARLELLREEARDIKFIRTSSEAEALIYEAGLIKDHAPKFNIELKDDKSYPYLKLTVWEKYPRLFMTRRRINDGSIYYGPYVNVKLLKEALSFMKKVFPLRTCRRLHKKVCLEYHIGQCVGPCEKKVPDKGYKEIVKQLKAFLEGRKDDLIRTLFGQMKQLSGKKQYEKALMVKQRVEALTAVQQLHDRSRYPIYGELDELKNTLNLPALPERIECFDISNIGGKQAVGSMIMFTNGKPHKDGYRRFRIRSVGEVDDYSMIREVVRRRYSRLLDEKGAMPDLILIDGGKGHLSVAKSELRKLELDKLPVASIAKEHNHLYIEARRHPIRLSPGSRLLFLVQRVRDEAHRFAIEYHRRLRRKDKFITELGEIKGVGPRREKLLIKSFGSVDNVRKASLGELKKKGIDRRTAQAIIEHFHLKHNK